MVKGDRRPSLRSSSAAVAGAVVLTIFGTAVDAAQATGQSQARSCADAVVLDWTDGSIDRAYAPDCYLSAIDTLPEDIRTYTSAEDDIARALQAQTQRTAARELQAARAELGASGAGAQAQPSASTTVRLPPVPVLAVAGLVLALLTAALTAAATRRLRRET